MQMSELVMGCHVQLDQFMIRTFDISEKELAGRLAGQLADIGQRRLEMGPCVDLLLIRLRAYLPHPFATRLKRIYDFWARIASWPSGPAAFSQSNRAL